MKQQEETTLERIRRAAMKEFQEKDFLSASLRRIVKAAGVTTGAFYGYFDSKEALFESLAGAAYDYLMSCFTAAQEEFAALPAAQQPQELGSISGACMEEMLRYSYEHLEEVKLILCHSEGTRFSRMIDEMVEIETAATNDFLSVLRSLPRSSRQVSPMLEHMVVGSMFAGFMEIVLHDMSLEEAREYSRQLMDFFTAGWLKIMGL